MSRVFPSLLALVLSSFLLAPRAHAQETERVRAIRAERAALRDAGFGLTIGGGLVLLVAGPLFVANALAPEPERGRVVCESGMGVCFMPAGDDRDAIAIGTGTLATLGLMALGAGIVLLAITPRPGDLVEPALSFGIGPGSLALRGTF